MMELVDTHCHIQSIGLNTGEKTTRELWAKAKDIDANSVIENANAQGVTRLVCVGCDLNDSQLAIDFAAKNQSCWASIGLHPHEARHYANNSHKTNKFRDLVAKPKVVAVGECGLDYFYTHSPKEDQLKILRLQIELALENDLPLIFHVREAFDDFWPVFNSYTGIRGVLHSYTDNLANLDIAMSKGLYIGVNGIATFVKDESQKAVYRSIPLKRLLLETDSPFLTPHPYRGSINQPMRVGVIADYLADLRGEKRKNLADTTTANAVNLFGI